MSCPSCGRRTPRSGQCRECARADAAEEQFVERGEPELPLLDEPCPVCGRERTIDGERPCAACRERLRADELYERKRRGESYEDVIWRVLDVDRPEEEDDV